MDNDVRTMIQFVNHEEEERVAAELAQKLNLAYINLINYDFAPGVLRLLPEDVVQQYVVISYRRNRQELYVATPDPQSQELRKFLEQFAQANGYQISIAVCSLTSFRYAAQMYQVLADQEQAEQIKIETEEAVTKKQFANKEELASVLVKSSTTQVLDILFSGATSLNASDIHIEPTEHGTVIRFRIDGVLQEVAKLGPEQYRLMRSRIKFLAKMKLNIVSESQDGRFDYEINQKKVDVRVSAVPTPYGETFVMRLLFQDAEVISLDQLGFTPENQAIINQAIVKPNGIIINTGPTGSGKTTTLYAILKKLNQPGSKIITIENPIEYRVEGITQTQVEPEKGYDFANALRSALRQDPDIIMVGEIRDPETAETAIQAALTGHLVLTTLHTKSAAASIPRLLDLGVRPYLLGGVMNLIIAQRLVRKVLGRDQNNQPVYKGRIAVAELLVPNDEIENLIRTQGSVKDFEEAAKRGGMKTLYEDGLDKVKAGLTTEEEVKRVALD